MLTFLVAIFLHKTVATQATQIHFGRIIDVHVHTRIVLCRLTRWHAPRTVDKNVWVYKSVQSRLAPPLGVNATIVGLGGTVENTGISSSPPWVRFMVIFAAPWSEVTRLCGPSPTQKYQPWTPGPTTSNGPI